MQLLDIVYREETLLNVIRSVTKNGRSILLTAVLAFILIYMFSIVGFMFFRDDFMIDVDVHKSDGTCQHTVQLVALQIYELLSSSSSSSLAFVVRRYTYKTL